MYFNFNRKDNRIENNLADLKPVLKHDFIVVGSDSKGKSYTTTVRNVNLRDARLDAKSWGKTHELKIDVVRAL